MACLIGMQNENGTGGKCFVLDNLEPYPEFAELMEALNAVNQLPAEHRPTTHEYDDTPMLAMMAVTINLDSAFELCFTNGKARIAHIEVKTIMVPPGVDPDALIQRLQDMQDEDDD